MEIKRHFTATVYIFCKNKVLLCKHKSLGKWMPIGGHIEENELPHEAALREVKEETGLDIKIDNRKPLLGELKECQALIAPEYLLLEEITPSHQHMDFIYYAKLDDTKLVNEYCDEQELKWFDVREIDKIDTFNNVKWVIKRRF
jgi:ADP-ribose pyrophosphatase YjhB (NUDIX family)